MKVSLRTLYLLCGALCAASSRDSSYYLSRWASKVAPQNIQHQTNSDKKSSGYQSLHFDDPRNEQHSTSMESSTASSIDKQYTKDLFNRPSPTLANKHSFPHVSEDVKKNNKDHLHLLNQFHTLISPATNKYEDTTPILQNVAFSADNFHHPPALPPSPPPSQSSPTTRHPSSVYRTNYTTVAPSLFEPNLPKPVLSSGLQTAQTSVSLVHRLPPLTPSSRAPLRTVIRDTSPQEVKEFPATSSEFGHSLGEDERDPRCE